MSAAAKLRPAMGNHQSKNWMRNRLTRCRWCDLCSDRRTFKTFYQGLDWMQHPPTGWKAELCQRLAKSFTKHRHQTWGRAFERWYWKPFLYVFAASRWGTFFFHGPKNIYGFWMSPKTWFQLVTLVSTLLLPCRCAFTFERIHPVWVISWPAVASRHRVSHQEVHFWWLSLPGPSVGLDWWACSAVVFGTYWKEIRQQFRTCAHDSSLISQCFSGHRLPRLWWLLQNISLAFPAQASQQPYSCTGWQMDGPS